MRRVEFNIDPNDPKKGIKTMSLVADPAIKSDFVFFSKEKSKYVELKATNYKQVVAGLALIPEKDILRFDANGEPFNGFFSASGIETIRNQFHKQEMTSEVNTDHSTNYVSAYLIESFIIDSPERLADVKAKGIDEATLGSWFVAYKIDDPSTFSKVIAGELKGFSVEIYLNQKFSKKEENNFNNVLEKYMNTIAEKLKAIFTEMEQESKPAVEETPKVAEPKKLESAADDDGNKLEYGAVGEPVALVSGAFDLDNGQTIVVDAGKLKSISPTADVAPAIADAPVKQEQVEAPKAEFSKENEGLKTELANMKAELEKLKKTPLAQPTKTVQITKQEFSQYELDKMLPAEKMRIKYGF